MMWVLLLKTEDRSYVIISTKRLTLRSRHLIHSCVSVSKITADVDFDVTFGINLAAKKCYCSEINVLQLRSRTGRHSVELKNKFSINLFLNNRY